MCFVSSQVSLEWFRLLSVWRSRPSRPRELGPAAPHLGARPLRPSARWPLERPAEEQSRASRLILMRGENRIRPEYQQGKSDYRQGSIPFGSLARGFNCTKVYVSLPWFYLKRLFVCAQEVNGER